MILTQYERQKLHFALEQKRNQMYKWSLLFLGIYFGVHIIKGIIKLALN